MHGTRKWHAEKEVARRVGARLDDRDPVARGAVARAVQDAAAIRLQLLWIHRESPRISATPRVIPSSAMHKPRIRAKANVQAAHDAAISPLDSNTPPQPARSLSAVFLEQGLDVVAAVGQYLFAPPGYERDPCPQNQRNIRKWMDGSNPEAMQHELDYEREYCRP